jgi:hypothetical protein
MTNASLKSSSPVERDREPIETSDRVVLMNIEGTVAGTEVMVADCVVIT